MNEVLTKEESKLEHANATRETLWIRGLWSFLNHANNMVVRRGDLGPRRQLGLNQKCLFLWTFSKQDLYTVLRLDITFVVVCWQVIPKAYTER